VGRHIQLSMEYPPFEQLAVAAIGCLVAVIWILCLLLTCQTLQTAALIFIAFALYVRGPVDSWMEDDKECVNGGTR